VTLVVSLLIETLLRLPVRFEILPPAEVWTVTGDPAWAQCPILARQSIGSYTYWRGDGPLYPIPGPVGHKAAHRNFCAGLGRQAPVVDPNYGEKTNDASSVAFVREKPKASYGDTGRPSIDPELLLRILLIGYLYSITSKRKLVEELRMHLAWSWFTGLGFDQGDFRTTPRSRKTGWTVSGIEAGSGAL
jgi:hypothetical protein